MTCNACGHANRAGRKFCAECGAALALACATCGTPYDAGEKFCGECGAPLGGAAARPNAGVASERDVPVGHAARDAGARKVVTIVFADLVGSTALHERLDAESARRVMERYYAALRAAVDAHGGTVVKLLGDGVMAAFGLKRVAEDDALRAVRAAAGMQDAFRALVEMEAGALGAAGLRVAVNTGEVVVSGARDDVIGDPVNVAARLQEQGSDGEVVLGEATRRLVATRVTLAPLGAVTLKGRAEAVAAYRLMSLDPPAGAVAAPFVGRESELERLEAVYDAALATLATRLAVLIGSPGLGKSRLIEELGTRHADDATILAAHCDAAGSATFAPIAQVLRTFLGVDDGAGAEAVRAAVTAALPGGDEAERARIGRGIAGLLSDAATSPEETFFVVRRFLASLAAAKPVVLVIDDVHWAEPLLLDLVEHLVQWGTGVPLFVLVSARPELRDLRSSLVTPGGVVADVVTLGGLDAGAAMRLAANVIGAADLPAAVAGKVLATSEGNPLFVGELVRMLVQEGALTKDGERWIVGASLAALEMPPTIHALLAARIERLGVEERTVLERASVVGRHFSRSAVAALLGLDGTELDARLESLRRSELIERDTGWLLGEPVMRFHHVLIRDAAYRRLLKGTRAELHARLADWIEAQVGDAPEHDELIGRHLEQAHQHLRELGPLDAAGAALGERAARRLAAAGRRALARDDVSLAAGLCGRALDRLTADAPERADLVLDWCEALLAAGDVGHADDAIAELERVAGDSRRLCAWHTCFAGQLTVLTAPEALHATSDSVGAAARELAALDDAAGEAKAHFVHAQALARLGKIGACEAALDQALAAARRAGDRRRANAVLAGAPTAALWGPSPVTRASGRCLDVVRVLRITQGAPAVEAVALSCQGVLEALRGRTEAARRMLASSRGMVEELGISHRLFETDVFAGRIALLDGDAPAAERALRAGYEGLRDLGLGIDAARAAALLGRALLAQDRAAEAETLSHESELLAGDDLQAAIAWRGVRAEALAARGEHAAAVELAKAAVEIAAATDALLDHADARTALAAAFRAAERHAEADTETRRAIELWETKGATLLVDGAKRVAGPNVSTGAPAEPLGSPEERTPFATPVRRRVRPNVATATSDRDTALIESGADHATLAALFNDAFEEIHHPTGSTYGREEAVASMERLMRSRDVRYRTEPLATLGPSLALGRRRIRASGTRGERFDVGEYENEALSLHEVDAQGRHLRHEVFATDRLGDAIARLYERYAESLPPGPARERAAVAARAAAFMLTPAGTADFSLLYAPTYQDVDHRNVGYGTLSPDEANKLGTSFLELAADLRFHIDDVLALEPNGFVRMTTSSGIWREGGGSFERTVCTLSVFGIDGRVTQHETFEPERAAEALARFDALTTESGALRERRRVRLNAAIRGRERFYAAVAARDVAALEEVFDESLDVVHHSTRATYGRRQMLITWRSLMNAARFDWRAEVLASLGDGLALEWHCYEFEGFREPHLADAGPAELEEIALIEADEHGRWRHCEIFAADRLGEAVVRLYERHAELLPEGPARARAAGTARAVATHYRSAADPDRFATALAPGIVAVDHRTVGFGTLLGREAVAAAVRALVVELSDDVTWQSEDMLALSEHASLVRGTQRGRARASGGEWERPMCLLRVHDADGLIARWEIFEPEQAADALARYDELTGACESQPTEEPFANAASRAFRAFARCWNARDWDGVRATYHSAHRMDDRRRLMRMEVAGDAFFANERMLFDETASEWRGDLLATRGDTLALFRVRFTATVPGSGPMEVEALDLVEVDAAGVRTVLVVFDPDDLEAAYGEIDARWQAGEGAQYGTAATSLEAIRAMLARRDWDTLAASCAPTFVAHDHRLVGWGTLRGPSAFLETFRAMFALAPDASFRIDHVRATKRGAIADCTWLGTRDGGAFESPFIHVVEIDEDGLGQRLDFYDPHHLDQARARFEEIARIAPSDTVTRDALSAIAKPTTATAAGERWEAVFNARDWEALRAAYAPDARWEDRRRLFQLSGGLDLIMSSMRERAETGTRVKRRTVETAGDRIVIQRVLWFGGPADGRFEIDTLAVMEVDESGRVTAVVVFDSEDVDAARREARARWAAIDPAAAARTARLV